MTILKWIDAITKVLEEEKEALHYTDIAQLIFERQYREPGTGGASPANTVNKQLNSNINEFKEKSKFVKVGKGEFILGKFLAGYGHLISKVENETEYKKEGKKKEERMPIESNKIINAFGVYWNRNHVFWKSIPDLLGFQQINPTEVNFKEQIGIYLLHDNRETIYVGQAIEQPLGQRLRNHTSDRLSGRWDRFSWFGLFPVRENGQLESSNKLENLSIQIIGDTLEAILIESIEPRQNRKQGNLFNRIEYLQKKSPELLKKQKEQLIRELTDKI